MNKSRLAILIVVVVLIADQCSKLWIKTHMMLGQEFRVLGNWFIIHFTENDGMAFGMDLPGSYGKILLSLFRIAAVIGIAFYIRHLIRKSSPKGVIVGLALILAGALGNIIDSAFYGLIFNESYFQVASMFPAEGGYAPFLYGRVVDMLYFPMINGIYPDWFPFVGGNPFIFFRPVFNLADSAITCGVLYMLIFERKFFADNRVGGK